MDIVTIDKLFSPEECEYLMSFSDDYTQCGVYRHGNNVFNDYRISVESSSNDETLKSFILDKIKFLNIISLPIISYLKYTKGSKFKLHRDRDDTLNLFSHRYKTLIIQLSDYTEYGGGDLIVENKKMPKEIGSLILFNSKCLHEVVEINHGIRNSLCIFLTKDNFKLDLL
jgi:predicted 2-oxoglutarate/Fe(II)-dependent dioxygenase YbiX